MSWTVQDEKKMAEIIRKMVAFLSEKDRPNLERASEHYKTSLLKQVKTWLRKELEPSLDNLRRHMSGTGNGVSEYISKILLGANASAVLRTHSVGDNTAQSFKTSDSQPYNYLANAFAEVMAGTAEVAEKQLFVDWALSTYGKGATAGATGAIPIHLPDGLTEGVHTAAQMTIDTALDQAEDLIKEFFGDRAKGVVGAMSRAVSTDPVLKELDLKHGPTTWAIYLAGETGPVAQPSVVENFRLALRLTLGRPFALDSHNKPIVDTSNFHGRSVQNQNPPNPKQMCQLLDSLYTGTEQQGRDALQRMHDHPNCHIRYLDIFLKVLKLDDIPPLPIVHP